MNRHLNVYTPYGSLSETHEDQLTRAAMIIMRAVPLARDAVLARIGARSSALLPDPEYDIQTGKVVELPDSESEDEAPIIAELISVFLSPDEGLDLSDVEMTEREHRDQRLDGVLRFGEALVVVIESKVVGQAAIKQAEHVNLHGVEVEQKRVVPLGWHEVFGDWWALLEHGLLSPSERVLLEDLVAYTEESFPNLLPFRTLRLAEDNELRLQRRMRALLREVTGLDGVRARPPAGAEVLMDKAPGTVSTQRIAIRREDEHLELATWPAELKTQAVALYPTDRAERLLELLATKPEQWAGRPIPQLAFRFSTVDDRIYMHCQLDLAEYVRRWTEEDLEHVHAYPPDTVKGELWPWLKERGYASAEDDQYLGDYLDQLGRRDAHLRPGIEVRRRWSWVDAVDLDDRELLAAEISEALIEILTALQEPLPPACQLQVQSSS